MQPNKYPIEEAIKLLQGEGYTVFNKAARMQVATAARTDARMLSGLKGESYVRHVQQSSGQRIGSMLAEQEFIEFTKEPLSREDHADYMTNLSFQLVSQFNFFPEIRREWKR